MNNAPDYVNRLTLFVAKMIHDGCYDAHSVDINGVFKYDPKKDNRFKTYFEKREGYNYMFKEGDEIYNNQRSLYIAMLTDFNLENKTLGRPELDEKKDLITKAYTHKEKLSIKDFADIAYGSFDHELQAM